MTSAAFQNVSKTYNAGPFRRNGIAAVRDVTFSIPRGSVFGLLGPNRAGKTTVIKLLLSLARPSSGNVSRLGEPLSERRTLARVGYMHENHAFPSYLSAYEVLTFYGGLSGVPTDELAPRVTSLLNRVGLADRQKESISRFSKGMVQRLGLAQSLINQPDLLILDEPTEGLDLVGRQLLRDVVKEFKQSGRTVLMVSHVLTEVQELCDELAVMVAGEVAYRGTLSGLTAGKSTLEAEMQRLYQKGTA